MAPIASTTVAVLDPNIDDLGFFERVLTEHGDQAHLLLNSEELLSLLDSAKVDTVIISLDLPNASGLALVHHVRALYPDILVLVSVGPSALEAVSSARALGAEAALFKPLAGDDVLLTLDQIRQTRIGKREVLQKTGIKDPQSSAYTSECFADFGARQIEASKRHDHRLSIATLVIRNWEALLQNVETAVHARLAARLVEVALECVRASDMIARIEPGQYAVLFTETSNLGALVATRRLLEMLQSDPQIQAVETEVPLGPTIGVASFPNDGKDIGTLMRISRERAFSRQRSLLGRLNLQTFEFWSTFDALLGSREDLGANELPRSALDRKETGLDKPSESFAHVLMSEAQAQCISRLLLQEICLRNGVPGVCYIHAGLLARADELDLANSRTVVHVLRPKGEWPQTPSGAADIPIDDPRLDDSRFVLFLGEFQWYGLIVRRIGDDLVWGLHFSDIGTVDELVNQLQKQYHLQRNLL